MKSRLIKNLLWLLLGVIYLFTVKHEDSVVFLDVGQGDAILVQKGDMQLLIDGGPDEKILYELSKYVPIYDRKIEYILLTHPHDDHLVGLLEVLERYDVGEILYYPVCYDNENYGYLLQNYDNLKEVGQGDTIRLKDMEVEVLWPVLNKKEKDCVPQFNNNLNNDSLVLSFEFLEKKFLLMGDIEKEAEEVMINEGVVDEQYNILKAGHHCSSSSSGETFLKMVSPGLAICSVGEGNSFGHPSSETLGNFSEYNVQYLVTYEQGNIQIK